MFGYIFINSTSKEDYMKTNLEKDKAKLGSSQTEAWADAKKYEKDTHINLPSEAAVENAKEWVDENEK
jgi:hypothetical protein